MRIIYKKHSKEEFQNGLVSSEDFFFNYLEIKLKVYSLQDDNVAEKFPNYNHEILVFKDDAGLKERFDDLNHSFSYPYWSEYKFTIKNLYEASNRTTLQLSIGKVLAKEYNLFTILNSDDSKFDLKKLALAGLMEYVLESINSVNERYK